MKNASRKNVYYVFHLELDTNNTLNYVLALGRIRKSVGIFKNFFDCTLEALTVKINKPPNAKLVYQCDVAELGPLFHSYLGLQVDEVYDENGW